MDTLSPNEVTKSLLVDSLKQAEEAKKLSFNKNNMETKKPTTTKLYLLARKSLLNTLPQVFSSFALAERELCSHAYEWHQWDESELESDETVKKFHDLFEAGEYSKAHEVLRTSFSLFVSCYSIVEVTLDDSHYEFVEDEEPSNEEDSGKGLQG